METPDQNNIKDKEVELRRSEVSKMHVRGYSVSEMADKLKVSTRTIDRDLYEMKQKRLELFTSSRGAKEWARDELADTVGFLDEARKQFIDQADNFKREASKSRALWYAVQVSSIKAEIFNSLLKISTYLTLAASALDLGEKKKPDFK